jgi:hypothetical protein
MVLLRKNLEAGFVHAGLMLKGLKFAYRECEHDS